MISWGIHAYNRPELIAFYSPFFPSIKETNSFINDCHNLQNSGNPLAFNIMNNIERLIGLSDGTRHLKKSKDAVQIMFWITCIESAMKLAEHSMSNKTEKVIEFFETYILDEDKRVLEQKIQYHNRTGEVITLNAIARMFYAIRNDYVHEGNFSAFQFALDEDINVENKILLGIRRSEETFQIYITYTEMRGIIIRALINFINFHK